MTAAPTSAAPAPRRKRRWLPRFGLRTLLILVALFGCGFGYLGHLYRRVAHQRYVVRKIQEAGGTVRYNWQLGMGDFLETMTDTDAISTRLERLADGTERLTRVSRAGTRIQTEKLPGPWIFRRLLGDDAFAFVESVDFGRFSHPTEPFEPQLLRELPHLKVLGPVDRQVSDEWLNSIARIDQLRVLNLSANLDASATSNGLALLKSAKDLEALSVSGEWLNDEAFAGIAKLHQLKLLSIGFSSRVTSAIFGDVGQLEELQEFSVVRASRIDDQKTQPLANLRNLRVLGFVDTPISDATLDHIAGLEKIESLLLTQTNVGDGGMQNIAGLSRLKNLQLGYTHVGDRGIEAISNLTRLRRLGLQSTNVTDACLTTIARLTQLEELELFRCNITDDGLPALKSLTNLQRLGIGPHISKEAANNLRKALPNCRINRFDESGSASLPED